MVVAWETKKKLLFFFYQKTQESRGFNVWQEKEEEKLVKRCIFGSTYSKMQQQYEDKTVGRKLCGVLTSFLKKKLMYIYIFCIIN
jgi:hypothetical protein